MHSTVDRIVRVLESATGVLLAIFLVQLVAYILSSGTAEGSETPRLTKGRTVVISGPIVRGNILGLVEPMLAMAQADQDTPIDIVISSPGGEVETGFIFVNVLEAIRGSGVRVRCFVPAIAASMAFQILLHCDERHALGKSMLLWHGVRTYLGGIPLTQELAGQLYQDFRQTNGLILRDLAATLGQYMPMAKVLYHFRSETLHVAENLAQQAPGFVTVHDYVPGLIESLLDQTLPSSQSTGQAAFRPGTMVYIYGDSWGTAGGRL